eukprot:jgi/Mesvir1/22233/Mv07733-RA.1
MPRRVAVLRPAHVCSDEEWERFDAKATEDEKPKQNVGPKEYVRTLRLQITTFGRAYLVDGYVLKEQDGKMVEALINRIKKSCSNFLETAVGDDNRAELDKYEASCWVLDPTTGELTPQKPKGSKPKALSVDEFVRKELSRWLSNASSKKRQSAGAEESDDDGDLKENRQALGDVTNMPKVITLSLATGVCKLLGFSFHRGSAINRLPEC